MIDVTYITKEGSERLQKELDELKGTARVQLSKRLREAIEQGDLSENADYLAAKEEQGFLEGRIQELEYILKNARIIDEIPVSSEEIGIGNLVTIQEDGYPPESYHLVGPKEANPKNGKISFESPIGKAIMNKRVGDVVKVDTPDGNLVIKIIKIEVFPHQ
jgi:transcription elongation factor GreA